MPRLHILILALVAATLLCHPHDSRSAADPVRSLVVAHSNTYPPFSFKNHQGNPQGYVIDMWRAFAQATGIEVSFRLTSWQNSLDLVKNGEADVHGGLFFNEERDQYMDFGPAIMELATVIYVRKGTSYQNLTQYPLGVVKGGFAESFIRDNRPNQPLVPFDSTIAAMEAARNQEIVAFASDQPTAIYYMRKYDIFDEFDSVETLYTNTLRAAVGEGKQEILETILHGWNAIDNARKQTILDRWFVESDTKPDWFLPGIALLAVIICIALIFRKIGQIRHGIN